MPSSPQAPETGYYFNLFTQARRFRVGLEQRRWCDLWHQHFDVQGIGNLGWPHRHRHLTALFTALAGARRELESSKQPYQLFALVHPRDSASDALVVHTPNPHGSVFPYALGGQPLTRLPPWLGAVMTPGRYTVRVARYDGQTRYIIQPALQSEDGSGVVARCRASGL